MDTTDKKVLRKETKIEETRGRSQKVKICVSVFRYGDKIISALGISRPTSSVEHRILKSKLKADELFNIVSSLTNDPYYKNDQRWAPVVRRVLDQNFPEIEFPIQQAKEFSRKPIGNLVHEVLNVEIELILK